MTTNDDLRNLIVNGQQDIKSRLDAALVEFSSYRKCVDAKISSLEAENASFRMDIVALKKEVNLLTNKERVLNMMLYNVEDNDNFHSALADNIFKLFKDAGINITNDAINEATRLANTVGKRPVLVCFNSKISKNAVFEKCESLKNKNVRISNDLTPMQRDERNKLL